MAIVSFPPRLLRPGIGQYLRAEREIAGHKQLRAAIEVGYSRRQWIYWEQDVMYPSTRAIRSIIKVYPNLLMRIPALYCTL